MTWLYKPFRYQGRSYLYARTHVRPEKVENAAKRKKKWLLNKIKFKKKTSYRKKTKEGGSNHELNHSTINNITINSERNKLKTKDG